MRFASVYHNRRLICAAVCETALSFLELQGNLFVIDTHRYKLLVLVYMNIGCILICERCLETALKLVCR
jgi:hypothetical protein